MTDKPRWLTRDPGDLALVAATSSAPEAQRRAELRRKARQDAVNKANERSKYTADTQPRDSSGRFRKILARLKGNLGGQATEELAKKIESTEQAEIAGNYGEVKKSGTDLIQMIDNIQDGDLPKGATKNLRRGASDLGKVLAYLPIPQGDPGAKIRFTDAPPASENLIRDMVRRVKEQLGDEEAKEYTHDLDQFMSGARTMSSDEMASNLNRLLRVLA